ncbi:hypothetical protein PG987_011791 [Apiospora arundinis]
MLTTHYQKLLLSQKERGFAEAPTLRHPLSRRITTSLPRFLFCSERREASLPSCADAALAGVSSMICDGYGIGIHRSTYKFGGRKQLFAVQSRFCGRVDGVGVGLLMIFTPSNYLEAKVVISFLPSDLSWGTHQEMLLVTSIPS